MKLFYCGIAPAIKRQGGAEQVEGGESAIKINLATVDPLVLPGMQKDTLLPKPVSYDRAHELNSITDTVELRSPVVGDEPVSRCDRPASVKLAMGEQARGVQTLKL
eukprot:scaffold132893_cov23-Prasinocladus_malaysianus.AAC.1